MRSVFDFIVTPVENRYDNEINLNGNKLIVNSSIENFKLISRRAIVLSTPSAYSTSIQKGDEVIIHHNVFQKGDEVIIHHNVFRRYYNHQGKEVDSSKTLDDNKYLCQLDQIYLYRNIHQWKPVGEHCFVIPIKNTDQWSQEPEEKNKGIVKIGNKTLKTLGINEGDLVGFKSNREFEFIVNKQRLYCMQSNDILVKYEFKGNEEEYNPSWAKSS
jgi:co-chaperonin GroES (HSP10)